MLNTALEILALGVVGVYASAAALLTAYTLGYVVLLVVYLRHRRRAVPTPPLTDYPTVTVQLPIYNERYVVGRLLEAVARLDYPRDRLTVQVLDDSDDDTRAIVARGVARLRREGLNIAHIRRPDRRGYKAGALAHGLTLTDAELIAVFDADFVPEPDFLRRTVPHFLHQPALGIVQGRWGHLNPDENLLTRAQSLAIDAHFVVEQTARNRGGYLTTFNGTGGVWRAQCIREAGGWSADTLTEDLDLSYRAQIIGWRYLFLPDVVVRGEVPAHIDAYRQQQARWSQGTNQTLRKLLPRLRDPRLSWGQRAMAVHQLGQYLPPVFLLTMFVLTPVVARLGVDTAPLLAPLGALGVVPPLLHALAQGDLQPTARGWLARMSAFPLTVVLGAGVLWNNARAALAAHSGKAAEFVRTPKLGAGGRRRAYFARASRGVRGELFLLGYALVALADARLHAPATVPYLALYALAFAGVIGWHIHDRWQLTSAPTGSTLHPKRSPGRPTRRRKPDAHRV